MNFSVPKDDIKPAQGLDLPPMQREHHKDRKSLAIALVVSAVFLLAAVGVAAWLFVQKAGGNTVITQIDPNSTTNVKSVSWVAPDMPVGYEKQGQSTPTVTGDTYTNVPDNCWVSTYVTAVGKDVDLQKTAAALGNTTGITAKNITSASRATIKDADGQRQYDFDAAEFRQEVSVPTTDNKTNNGFVYFKQFGNDLAAVSFTCKAVNYEVNAEDLTALLQKFTVKTER